MDEQKNTKNDEKPLKKKRKVVIPHDQRIPDSEITEEYMSREIKLLSNQQRRILDLVYRFRILNTKDIQKALGYTGYPRFVSQLKKLHEKRFLDRSLRPMDLRIKTKGKNGENELYHMLDLAGAYFIRDYYGLEKLSDVKWSERENRVSYDYALHSLKISELYAKMEEELKVTDEEGREKYPGEKIIEAMCDKHLYIRYKDGRDYCFSPDMFFKYYRDNKVFGFFVEVDRGTMAMQGSANTKSFDQKVFYYEGYKENKSDYLGFSYMPRVLVVTTTKKRAEDLAAAVKAKQNEIGKSGVMFLFTFFSVWEKNPFGKIFIDQNYGEEKIVRTMFN